MNKAHKELLKENYEKACNAYVLALLNMWGLDAHYGYFVGDEVGGVYDYGDGMFTIGMDEIIYCVVNNISKETFYEFQEYNIEAHSLGFDYINLKSWCKGCPRLSKEQIKELRDKRKELDDLCEQYKKNLNATDF